MPWTDASGARVRPRLGGLSTACRTLTGLTCCLLLLWADAGGLGGDMDDAGPAWRHRKPLAAHHHRRPQLPYSLTLRYTACGGLFNQHYSHLAALLVALRCGADAVVWPPLQERASFANKFDMRPALNQQTWQYLPATLVWDLNATAARIKRNFGLTVEQHHADCRLPDMTHPAAAFQLCPVPPRYDIVVQLRTPIYLQKHSPNALAHVIHSQLEAELRGRPARPAAVLLDLPCTMFAVDTRGAVEAEGLARSIRWNPRLLAIAQKVVTGIRGSTHTEAFNGIHLRMEKDAHNWQRIMGGMARYWMRYKLAMRRAGFRREPLSPLFIASGLMKSSKEDAWSKERLDALISEIVARKFASHIVYKEQFLSDDDLVLGNEQSALVDFLVLRQSSQFVGIGVSTFSFYLSEARILAGLDPSATELIMMPYIGTDELFFTSAVVATVSRARLATQGLLRDLCRRPDLLPCFSTEPRHKPQLMDLPEDLGTPRDGLGDGER